jgi:hypothetical protein
MKPQQARALVAEIFPKAFDKVRLHQFANAVVGVLILTTYGQSSPC